MGGQLGDGTKIHRTIPIIVNINNSKPVKQVATGMYHTCAIADDDTLYCWGSTYYGQVGDGTQGNRVLPRKIIINGGMKIKQLALGADHTCVILYDDSLWCWGKNTSGQLGNGTTKNRYFATMINVGNGRHVTQIGLGYFHTCAKLDNNKM